MSLFGVHKRQRLLGIMALALPIMGGMLSQSLLNLIDAAMVGSLGGTALAGVGIGGYINFVAVSMIIGLSSAVQALVARRAGQGDTRSCATPLNIGLILAVCVALPLSVALYYASPLILSWVNPDRAVSEIGSDYFQARVLALVFVAMNFSFRGYWNGIHRSMVYLRILIVMHLSNVLISYGLIFGAFGLPELGAVGAGYGTSIAMLIGAGLYFAMTYRAARPHGFLSRRPTLENMRSVLRLALPNSLQQLAFALGITLMFWIIGQIGTTELAVAHVLVNLSLFLILPGVGLGMAATTLVSRSLGENDTQGAYQWGVDVVKIAVIIIAILGLPFWLAPEFILGIFLIDSSAIALGVIPLQISAAGMIVDAAAIVLTQALLGAGANRMVMKVSTTLQWGLFLPLAWVLGPVLGYGLTVIWILQLLQRCLSSLLFGAVWQRKQWAKIRI